MSEREFIVLAYPDEASRNVAVEALRPLLFQHGNDAVSLGTVGKVAPLLVDDLDDALAMRHLAENLCDELTRPA